MDIALIGPTHPYKGGIAQHTTRLAGRLAQLGATPTIVTWYRQYPRRLYPGMMTLPDEEPEVEPFERVVRALAWNRPDTWVRAAYRLRRFDAAVFVVVTPVQLVAYLVMLPFIGRHTATVALVHNVLPHEPGPLDRPLVSWFMRRCGATLTHTDSQAAEAAALGARRIRTQLLPANIVPRPLPGRERTDPEAPLEVLFFGLVRPYKGVDVLIRAAAEVPEVRLTVAGEFWVDVAELERLVEELGITSRVRLRNGYVPAEDLPELFASCHLVALPYRDATGSGNIRLALDHEVPVVVTRVGDLPEAVAGGVGLVCEPDDVASLADALRAVTDVDRLAAMRAAVRARESAHDTEWQEYARAVLDCAAQA